MTARVLDGTATAARIRGELGERVAALAERGVVPGLGTVLVGDDPGSRAYVAGKHRDCAEVGIASIEVELPATATQAEVEEQVRQVDATTARLAQEAEQLQEQQRQVAEKHDEMQRHLADMREWYRRKLRELAGVDAPPGDEPGAGDVVPMPASESVAAGDRNPARAVLTLND